MDSWHGLMVKHLRRRHEEVAPGIGTRERSPERSRLRFYRLPSLERRGEKVQTRSLKEQASISLSSPIQLLCGAAIVCWHYGTCRLVMNHSAARISFQGQMDAHHGDEFISLWPQQITKCKVDGYHCHMRQMFCIVGCTVFVRKNCP